MWGTLPKVLFVNLDWKEGRKEEREEDREGKREGGRKKGNKIASLCSSSYLY